MTRDNLRDVIGLRMQLAREVLDLAEEHRDEVWTRLRSRISDLQDEPEGDARKEATARPAGPVGPERRPPPPPPPPAEPMYAGEEPTERRLRWPRLGLVHVAGALIAAAAVAAAIALS